MTILLKQLISLSLFTVLFISCSIPGQNMAPPPATAYNFVYDSKYDSNFPVQPTDEELNRILESVMMISNLTFYESYEFAYETRLSIHEIHRNTHKDRALKKILFERPASGTATVIFQEGRKVALLTCDHIVFSPDTIITYYDDALGIRTPFIKNIALKSKETNNIIFLPGQEEVRVLARDVRNDIALISVQLNEIPKFRFQVFDYKLGRAEELTWGTFVYIIGYPYGKKIVSSGLVSSPNRDRKHSFIVDATMHKGISGGIILALRDGSPNFELVGLANAISGEQEFVLRPDPAIDERDFQSSQQYLGKIYLDTQVKINYGITFAVSIETIKNFLKKNRRKIEDEGLYLGQFFD